MKLASLKKKYEKLKYKIFQSAIIKIWYQKIIYILNNFNKKQDKQTQNYVIDAKCNDCVAENIQKNIFACVYCYY